ncbi:anthranilate phosphoribosyltransferase [Paenibacillus caui]|uniref:anthranilate phosphoribosyltransferase n=1 Tax=Paenibacillus caui TaxID=2873927 RepID=UPI001CAA1AB4|nr:anthranilate phosphoribosyltransferase [Paenibacillus caui]
MIDYLKEVARGKRGARDLSYDDAWQAAESILNSAATPAQIGAFLAAERIKLESIDELEAFVRVCRGFARREQLFPENLDCAGPYDGRKSSFIATFPTAFLLSAAGLPVTLHGCAPLPPKWGITLHDILTAAGIDISGLSPDKFILAARESGVLYVNSEQWSPKLGSLRPIREELGMRTIFNTVEKLVDYGHSPFIVYGIYHNTVFDRISRLMIKLGYRKALIVQGQEGSEDLFIDRPTRIYIVENGEPSMSVIDPEIIGLDTPVPDVEWTPALQLSTAEEVLHGAGHLAFYHQTLLNGAVRLKLAGRVGSVEEGLYTCKNLLDSGAAMKKYNEWKKSLLTLAKPASGIDSKTADRNGACRVQL